MNTYDKLGLLPKWRDWVVGSEHDGNPYQAPFDFDHVCPHVRPATCQEIIDAGGPKPKVGAWVVCVDGDWMPEYCPEGTLLQVEDASDLTDIVTKSLSGIYKFIYISSHQIRPAHIDEIPKEESMEFKIGDTVRVKSEEKLLKLFEEQGYVKNGLGGYTKHYVSFGEGMFSRCGKTFRLKKTVSSDYDFGGSENSFDWLSEWLEPVAAEEKILVAKKHYPAGTMVTQDEVEYVNKNELDERGLDAYNQDPLADLHPEIAANIHTDIVGMDGRIWKRPSSERMSEVFESGAYKSGVDWWSTQPEDRYYHTYEELIKGLRR